MGKFRIQEQSHLFKNSSYLVISTFAIGFINYVYHIVLSRLLSVPVYGELQTLIALTSVLDVINISILNYTIQHTSKFAKNKDYQSNSAFIGLLNVKNKTIIIVLAIFYLFLVPIFGSFFQLSSYYPIVLVAISSILLVAASPFIGSLMGWEYFGEIALLNFTANSIKLISGIVITNYSPTIGSASISIFSIGFTASILTYYFYFSRLKIHYNSKDLQNNTSQHLSKYNIEKNYTYVSVFTLLNILVSNIDILLLQRLANSESTGYYSTLSILGKTILWVNSAVVTSYLPKLLSEGNSEKNKSLQKLITVFILGSGFVATMIYYFFHKEIILLFFGSKYTSYSELLWQLGIFGTLLSFIYYEANKAFALKKKYLNPVLAIILLLMGIGNYFYYTGMKDFILVNIISLLVGYLLFMIQPQKA